MTIDNVDEFLEHHGVKGQRWGQRKKSSSSGSGKLTPKTKKPHNPTKHLSNHEMKQLVERMNLERQFSELSRPKAKAGSEFAKGMLEKSGNVLIGAFVTAGSALAVKAVMTKLGK